MPDKGSDADMGAPIRKLDCCATFRPQPEDKNYTSNTFM